MQSQRAHNDEVSALSDRLVGARGANAAQRAARVFPLASVSESKNADGNLSTPPSCRSPASRAPPPMTKRRSQNLPSPLPAAGCQKRL